MSEQNHEQRIAELEKRNRKMARFCVTLLTRIHGLDKKMAHNLGQLAEAINDPAHFDIEDYRTQLARADSRFDQMDAILNELEVPQSPENPPPAPSGS